MAVTVMANTAVYIYWTDLQTLTRPTRPRTKPKTDNDFMYTNVLLYLAMIFVLFFKIKITTHCQLHTLYNLHLPNKLFHMLVVQIVPLFWLGRILISSCKNCSISFLCVLAVLLIMLLNVTCMTNGTLSFTVNDIITRMYNALNGTKSNAYVLKNHKRRDRYIVKHLTVSKNCKNNEVLSMIMMIYFKPHQHVQKDINVKAMKVLTLNHCQLNSCSYIDALGPNVHCCQYTGINERLISMLIRFNSNFGLHFLFSTTLAWLFDLFMTSYWLARFIRSQNRKSNFSLDLTVHPKTESRKYTRKNGASNTCHKFIRSCKLKMLKLRRRHRHWDKVIPSINTLIIEAFCIKQGNDLLTPNMVNAKMQQHAPTYLFWRKNHDHRYTTTCTGFNAFNSRDEHRLNLYVIP